MDNDNIVYQARLHWVIFTWPVLVFCIIVVLGVKFEWLREASLLLGALVLLWAGCIFLLYRACSLTIKTTQIILRKGVFSRFTLGIPLSKIESIDIRQSMSGTLLGYGNIVITGTGGSREELTYISKPLTCRRYIEQLLHG